MTGVAILILVGSIVFLFAANASTAKKLDHALGSISHELAGGTYDVSSRTARGEIAGAAVTFRYVIRGSGKSAKHWTEIEVAVPPQYPLRLFIRKHGWLDQGRIERGELVDVVVGDPRFDRAFLVEAAPADVARILIDTRERAYLLDLSERLWFEITSEPGTIKLSVRTWVMDLTDAAFAIEAMAAIAGRLRDAYARAAGTTEVEDVGAPYRPMLDDTAAKEAADARLAEVARIDQTRTARAAREQTIAVLVIIGFVLFALVAIATSQ